MTFAGFVVSPRPAGACSIAPTFAVTLDHLAAGDFNEPDSQLARDYREWSHDDDATIKVLGVYVYETIHTVEPKDDWSRGGVSVPVEMWGQWPEDPSARAISPEDRSSEPPTTCGWGTSGRPLGTRDYTMIADVNGVDLDLRGENADEVLAAAFGAPAIAERDTSLEQDLIAQIETSRTSRTGLFVAAGLVAIALAAGVLYKTKRSGNAGLDGEVVDF